MLSFCSLVCLLFVGACRLLRLVQPDGFIDLLRLEDEEEKEGEEGRRGEEEEGEIKRGKRKRKRRRRRRSADSICVSYCGICRRMASWHNRC